MTTAQQLTARISEAQAELEAANKVIASIPENPGASAQSGNGRLAYVDPRDHHLRRPRLDVGRCTVAGRSTRVGAGAAGGVVMSEPSPSPWHVLYVKENDPEYPGEDTEYSVTCPHDRTNYDRDCVMWIECGCTSTDPYEDDQPCPNSPTSEHQMVTGGPPVLFRPSTLCFVADNEYLLDAAADLSPGPGGHQVSYEIEDFEYLSLELIVNEPVTR